jgi:hypothetical protein
MAAPTSMIRPAPAASGEPSGLLHAFTSLPCVSETLQAITTYNIGPVTELLESAAYFPLLLTAASRRTAGVFEVETEARRFEITTLEAPIGGRLLGVNRAGGPAAGVRFRWRVVPEDYVGTPGLIADLHPLPLQPEISQRVEVFDWELRFQGGASGYRAYGTGRTLPGAGTAGPGVGIAFVLDVLEGLGQLSGLAGTAVASGTVGPDAGLALMVMSRIADPAGGLIANAPVLPPPPGSPAEPGATYLTFLGQVDPENPVTLRVSLTEGFLGSNVFELLRVAELDFTTAGGQLRSRADRRSLAGTVSARLSFDPLTLCPIAPIQTRQGIFTFHDQAGRSLGTLASDMTEGRSFRTSLEGMLLPVFRFGGFGPILGGTGEFAGARGIMTMNSVISVQPRTLSNLYVLRLDDPDGRYRALTGGGAG